MAVAIIISKVKFMNKKNIATTVILILCSLLFATIGSTFMNLLYEKNKIVVKNPMLMASAGILVYKSDDQTKTQITQLEFNSMDLGLKPVTGEADEKTNIPSTVTEKKGTEGLYAELKVSTATAFRVKVVNLQIDSKQDEEKLKKEHKNLWVALKDVEDSAKNLENGEVVLLTENEGVQDKEYILYFWLSGDGKALKGARISFDVQFETLV